MITAVFVVIIVVHGVPVAHAQLTATKTCTGPNSSTSVTVGDTATCTLTITGNVTAAVFPFGPNHDTITIHIVAIGGNYTLTSIGSASCTPTPSSATCSASTTNNDVTVTCANPCGATTIQITLTGEQLQITSAQPTTVTQRVTVAESGATFDAVATITIRPRTAGTQFFLAPANNDPPPSDANDCLSADTPCATFERVLHGILPTDEVARDGDSIELLAGTYLISQTVFVDKLVTIEPNSGAKVILKATQHIAMFQVTAQGSPSLHVVIHNFTMGGCTPPRRGPGGSPTPTPTPSPANAIIFACTAPIPAAEAFLLTDDNYTEIGANIIGAEDLPIDNGIVLSNSDHTNIHDNTIQGNSRLIFTPLLIVGQNPTGFGIVTFECLGGAPAGTSDSVTINNNLFTNAWIAGIWMCSDGAGEHAITNNTFRNNWRGIALKDVTDSSINTNTLTDDKSDGIILYGASLRNTVDSNLVESHVGIAAAAIRVGWIADPIMPLSNTISNNKLIRDTIALHVFGARTTVITGNQIKISGNRTAVLITPSTFPGDPGTQPTDTEITGNTIVFIGPCSALIGCGIRLVGTTVSVLATDNDWGLRRVHDVEGIIWHHNDNPLLGVVTFTPFRNMVVETPTPTPSAASAGSGAGISGTPVAGSGAVSGGTTSATGTATPGAASVGGGTVTIGGSGASGAATPPTATISLTDGCQLVRWPGPTGVSVVDAIMGISPPAAQANVTIWQRQADGSWRAFSPADGDASEVFLLQQNETLNVCVTQAAQWEIPTEIGGP